jgi:peptidoglycan/LPS O-acetylase OafA/YrhL
MQRQQKLDALTSMRFVAAAMIVIGHASLVFGSIGIQIPVPTGQGVSFFFVLSGFILAYNYPNLANASQIRHFYLARFARVWPLHAFTCILWIGLIYKFDRTYFPGLEGVGRLLANIFLLQAWVPFKDWSLSFNGVSWSLSAEFFFYACFPFLIAAWKRSWHWLFLGQVFVVVAMVSIGHFWSLPPEDEYRGIGLLGVLYFNPLVRILEFTIGITTAQIVRQVSGARISISSWQWFVLELAAILGVVMSLLSAASFSGLSNTLGTSVAYYFTREGLWLFWAILIGVFALSHGPITRLLSARFPVFLGEISFSLYLCHSLTIHYLLPYTDKILSYGLIGYLLFWAFCLFFSSLLFIGVESPGRKVILAWADRKNIPFALKISVSSNALASLIMLSIISVGMATFRPSFISPLDKVAVSGFLKSPNTTIINNVTFDERYVIIGVQQISTGKNKAEVNVMIRAKRDLVPSDVIALHLNDVAGNIIYKPGDVVLDKAGQKISAGTQWIQHFQVNESQLRQAKTLGLAMYSGAKGLFKATGEDTDWGGKRLIVVVN